MGRVDVDFGHGFVVPSVRRRVFRMLAAKTTCKDRWGQVINEAHQIKEKHLLTLQEGISENQFAEMREEGIQPSIMITLLGFCPDPLRTSAVLEGSADSTESRPFI
jgi:EcoRII C terminal